MNDSRRSIKSLNLGQMAELSALCTAWHKSQSATLNALATLLENWRPIDHARYEQAVAAEKEAERAYLLALRQNHYRKSKIA